MPQVRRRAREADEWRARRTGLPQLVADEDRGAIFRGAQRRARSQPLSDLLWRRRVRRTEYRLDAWIGELLQTRRRLEASRGRPEIQPVPRRQGRRYGVLDLASRRGSKPQHANRQST